MLERIENKLNTLNISKIRKKTDKYSELVFFNKDLKKWDRALSGILGPPLKSRWKKPDENLTTITRTFGGIRVGQTLYYKEFDDCKILAMIWPWKDKTHTTLKLSKVTN
ncbi:MAG: hypothetical protein KKD44_07995 [Proteobacteria bacterium]|nr:hypothetical protein [Pseudomonadota bacterium]